MGETLRFFITSIKIRGSIHNSSITKLKVLTFVPQTFKLSWKPSRLMLLNISCTSFSTKKNKKNLKTSSPCVFRLVLLSHGDRPTYWQISSTPSSSFLSTRQGYMDTLTNMPSSLVFTDDFFSLFFFL